MDFTSDNICGVSKEILTALSLANEAETAAPYGADVMSMSLNQKFSELFKRPAFVFPVVTGTAANALALSALVQPWQAVLTHEKAHIEIMECGAPEFFTGGAKLIGVKGEAGKLDLEHLECAVRNSGQGSVHRSQIAVISITQTTDFGEVYSVEELKEITDFAKANNLRVHVDGARFANAVAALACDPADLVEGVDVLSFGATKNGTMNAEALVFFDEQLAQNFSYLCKRSGHIVSKSRYLSAQLLAYIENDLWLENARAANNAARYLAEQLSGINDIRFIFPVKSNLVFIEVDASVEKQLRAAGIVFYSEGLDQPDRKQIRLVCGFSTTQMKIDQFVNLFLRMRLQQQAA